MSSSLQRSRHREQREATRREILAAAERLLRQRPYRELSVEDVMAQTGLTRTAFYRHFDDVTEMVLRLLAEVGQELYAIAERWQAYAGSDYPVAAREALSGIVDFFVAHGPLVRAVAEAAATDAEIERAWRGFMETFIEMTKTALDRLTEAGQVRVPDTLAVARALNLMNEAYLLNEFGSAPFGDPEVVRATLETVWLRALGRTERAPQ